MPPVHGAPMLDVLFDPVDGGDMLFRNVGILSRTKCRYIPEDRRTRRRLLPIF
jgi:hypothetical protein